MIIILTVLTIITWLILDYCYAPRLLENEPPLVPHHSVPYIGHILGLLRHGTRYYELTSLKCKLPIYTLKMLLSSKIYVVTSPELVSAVNRNAKTLSFNPFIAQLGKRITNHDQATGLIVQHNLNGENGSGYVIDVHDGTLTALAPGKALEDMTLAMVHEVSICLDAFDQTGSEEMDFFAWTRKTVTMCSTKAIYGPENPFSKYPELEEAFWEFDHDLNLLMLNIAPSILAPKGHSARTKIGAAFTQYFENYIPGQTQSSAMTLARYTANTRHGISFLNQGLLEVGTLIGILANTIPSLFYLLVRICADDNLLQDIRAELETTAVLNHCGGGGGGGGGSGGDSNKKPKKKILQILTMREKCPLLHSTFQELLRFHAKGASSRFVREDTMIDDQYLLKKGMIVQMPMAVMHFDPAIWGPDVLKFVPRRFLKNPPDDDLSKIPLNEKNRGLKSNPKEEKRDTKQNLTGYRPFGGGASLCPGRHFVTLEALALAAIMVLRYDIEPLNNNNDDDDNKKKNSGEWSIPPQKQESLATNVFPPAHDIKVRIRRRKGMGMEDVEWGYVMA